MESQWVWKKPVIATSEVDNMIFFLKKKEGQMSRLCIIGFVTVTLRTPKNDFFKNKKGCDMCDINFVYTVIAATASGVPLDQ